MHPDIRERVVSRLRALVDQKPQQAMDELESLVRRSSVRELAEVLCAVYGEISGEMGIDWYFTVLQWKLGNRGREQFQDIFLQARFTVWSFAYYKEADAGSETRYITCLPFCFKPEWIQHGSSAARTETLT
jgi:hypothetical protein